MKESYNFKRLKKHLKGYSPGGEFKKEDWKSTGLIWDSEALIREGWTCINQKIKESTPNPPEYPKPLQTKYPTQCLCEVNIQDLLCILPTSNPNKVFAIIGNVCINHFEDAQMSSDFAEITSRRSITRRNGTIFCETCGRSIPLKTMLDHAEVLDTKRHLGCLPLVEENDDEKHQLKLHQNILNIEKVKTTIRFKQNSDTFKSAMRNYLIPAYVEPRLHLYQPCLPLVSSSIKTIKSMKEKFRTNSATLKFNIKNKLKLGLINGEKRGVESPEAYIKKAIGKQKRLSYQKYQLEKSLSFVIKFGKYEGWTLYKIYRSDKGYLKWASKNLTYGDTLEYVKIIFKQENQLIRWIKRKKPFLKKLHSDVPRV